MKTDVYEAVTTKMIAALEAGTVPWHKPWKSSGGQGLPMSISSGKPYRGINVFILGFEAQAKGYQSDWWATYEQMADRAGMIKNPDYKPFTKGSTKWISPDGLSRGVRKGEHPTLVVFWKKLLVDDKDESGAVKRDKSGNKKQRSIMMLRYFNVFNADQVDGLPAKFAGFIGPEVPGDEDEVVSVDEAAEALVADYLANGPRLVSVDANRAYYSPSQDLINLPPRESFDGVSEYYSTLYHEIGHSTGHASRLAREGVVENHYFGDALYSAEELVAEMTAAMLSATAGVDQSSTFNNSAAYLANWLKVLKGDHKLVVQAAAKAQKAADLAQSITWADEVPAAPEAAEAPEVAA